MFSTKLSNKKTAVVDIYQKSPQLLEMDLVSVFRGTAIDLLLKHLFCPSPIHIVLTGVKLIK